MSPSSSDPRLQLPDTLVSDDHDEYLVVREKLSRLIYLRNDG